MQYLARWPCVLGTVVWLLVIFSRAQGAPIGSPPLATLEAKAGAIVVAVVADDPTVTGTGSDTGASLTLLVERVIKGDRSLRGSLPVRWSMNRTVSSRVTPRVRNTCGLFFLQGTPTGPWQLIAQSSPGNEFDEVHIPAACGSLQPEFVYASDASVIEKLLSEIANAADQLYPKELGLQFVNYGLLESFKSDVPRRLYARLASSGTTERRAAGIAGLIRQGSSAALARLEREAATLLTPRTTGVLCFSIGGYYRNADPAGIALLGRMANSASYNHQLRKEAGYALAAMHSRDTLPHLARLLDDPDTELASYGVGGLAMFANNVAMLTVANVGTHGHQPLPGPAEYRTQETMEHATMGKEWLEKDRDKYILFWKAWWARNGGAIMK
jgi:hypothetical protein